MGLPSCFFTQAGTLWWLCHPTFASLNLHSAGRGRTRVCKPGLAQPLPWRTAGWPRPPCNWRPVGLVNIQGALRRGRFQEENKSHPAFLPIHHRPFLATCHIPQPRAVGLQTAGNFTLPDPSWPCALPSSAGPANRGSEEGHRAGVQGELDRSMQGSSTPSSTVQNPPAGFAASGKYSLNTNAALPHEHQR